MSRDVADGWFIAIPQNLKLAIRKDVADTARIKLLTPSHALSFYLHSNLESPV
jgi:hypothetical protein